MEKDVRHLADVGHLESESKNKQMNLMRNLIITAVLIFTAFSTLFPQPGFENRELQELIMKYNPLFTEKMDMLKIEGVDTLPIGERIEKTALSFEGTPYKPKTLEGMGEEFCRFNLEALDCVTLVENSLCISRILPKKNSNIEDFVDCLTFTRYRGGKIDGYPSRLHYTADWIYDNIKKGVVRDITKELGGIEVQFNVHFMTDKDNLKYYKDLQINKNYLDKMKEIEKEINGRKYYYLPQNKINQAEDKIQSGDIIAITTSIEGLDYSHMGIAYRNNFGKVRLLHASTVYRKVVPDKDLSDYILGNKSQTGITVLRPLPVSSEVK